MLTKNSTAEYTALYYTDAETVGTIDGTTVFVPQMLVGEKALIRIDFVNVKKNVAYGTVARLIVSSPARQIPPCSHFGKCGGCALMHMNYAEQLCFKQNKVCSNLKKIGGLHCSVLPTVASSKTLGYRNKLALPIRGEVGNVQIGMFEKGSHSVVDVQNCLLGGDWSCTLVGLFRKFINENRIVPYNEQNFSGQVRHLVARCVDGQLLVTVVTNGKCDFDLQPFAALLAQNFSRFGLFVNSNYHKNNVILGQKTEHVCGTDCICGENLGVKFRLQPNSFFQVNDEIKDAIYRKVRELLDVSNTEVLIDCFSGVGVLTSVLASEKYATYAVEIVPEAVADARKNAVLNNSPNVTNVCGDATVELPKIVQKHRGKICSLVVDPPRKGLNEAICNTILNARVDNIVYISCDSATLARDLKQLSAGYVIDYVQPWDMFPQTAEVETVVHLTRRNSKEC